MAIIFKNILAQLIFNCPLLPSPRNNLAGKWPMTQKFLATPLNSNNHKIIKCSRFHNSGVRLHLIISSDDDFEIKSKIHELLFKMNVFCFISYKCKIHYVPSSFLLHFIIL